MPGSAPAAAWNPTRLYPTIAGGREWTMPADATVSAGEWWPEYIAVTRAGPGAFEVSGQVRLSVISPAGKSWWRNVEITAYVRNAGVVTGPQPAHWELFGRGERHTTSATLASDINRGVLAPPGTQTWPWYGNVSGAVNPHCLGTAYHANFFPSGLIELQKEISHQAGYSSSRAASAEDLIAQRPGEWLGLKLIVADGPESVHLEAWVDPLADGNWHLRSSTDDAGGWLAKDANLDGCNAPPYSYAVDQMLRWSSPTVTFRSDGMRMHFAGLSVREIAPR